jgi:hypothetical protein
MKRAVLLLLVGFLSLPNLGCLSWMPERVANATYRQSIDVTLLNPPAVREGGGVELWVWNGSLGCLRVLLPNDDFRRASRNLAVGQVLQLREWDLNTLDNIETLVVRAWKARDRQDAVAAAFGPDVHARCLEAQTPPSMATRTLPSQ